MIKRKTATARKAVVAKHESLMAAIAKLMVTGQSIRQIASQVGVNKSTCHLLMGRVRTEWKESRLGDVEAMVTEQLAKLAAIEVEAWQGWQRSCKDAEIITTKVSGDGTTTETKRHKQAGVLVAHGLRLSESSFSEHADSCMQHATPL